MRVRRVMPEIARPIALGAWVLAAAFLPGCASSPAMRAAENGDRPALKREIGAREKTGSLSNDDAAKLARAVASREIASAPKDQATARVREVRACAPELDSALASRMKTHDAAGAEAALARIEARNLSDGALRDEIADPDDAWRAAGARGLTREADRASRARLLVDPAPAVRRAAMHAAIAANDATELDAIGEAARLDPDPMVRSEAVRAIAQIGGASAVARLRDLWANADDPIREDIAIAWSSPAVRSAGGRDALRVLLAAEHGPGAIDGAAAALRGDVRDGEIDASATALLARTIQAGSPRDRLHAIAVAPSGKSLTGDILSALRSASKDADSAVRVGALARLVESAPDAKAAIAALEGIAGQPSTGQASSDAASSRAKLALASAGDTRIQAWIEADLTAASPEARLSAASALAALGRVGRAAPLLADDDASVRTRAACTILLGARFRH